MKVTILRDDHQMSLLRQSKYTSELKVSKLPQTPPEPNQSEGSRGSAYLCILGIMMGFAISQLLVFYCGVNIYSQDDSVVADFELLIDLPHNIQDIQESSSFIISETYENTLRSSDPNKNIINSLLLSGMLKIAQQNLMEEIQDEGFIVVDYPTRNHGDSDTGNGDKDTKGAIDVFLQRDPVSSDALPQGHDTFQDHQNFVDPQSEDSDESLDVLSVFRNIMKQKLAPFMDTELEAMATDDEVDDEGDDEVDDEGDDEVDDEVDINTDSGLNSYSVIDLTQPFLDVFQSMATFYQPESIADQEISLDSTNDFSDLTGPLSLLFINLAIPDSEGSPEEQAEHTEAQAERPEAQAEHTEAALEQQQFGEQTSAVGDTTQTDVEDFIEYLKLQISTDLTGSETLGESEEILGKSSEILEESDPVNSAESAKQETADLSSIQNIINNLLL